VGVAVGVGVGPVGVAVGVAVGVGVGPVGVADGVGIAVGVAVGGAVVVAAGVAVGVGPASAKSDQTVTASATMTRDPTTGRRIVAYGTMLLLA
jgi:hypothetical protein